MAQVSGLFTCTCMCNTTYIYLLDSQIVGKQVDVLVTLYV